MATLKPKAIVVHVSASRWGDAATINQWHLDRGWPGGIGYHRVVLNGSREANLRYAKALDGKIEPGRPEDVVGAHCSAGGMNHVALGVCLIGNPGWPAKGTPAEKQYTVRPYATQRQIEALLHVLATWCKRYNLDPEGSFQHRGRRVWVISQHSSHESEKPHCASLNLDVIRPAVARRLRDL